MLQKTAKIENARENDVYQHFIIVKYFVSNKVTLYHYIMLITHMYVM